MMVLNHQVTNLFFFAKLCCISVGDGELVAEPISVVLKCHVMLQKEDGKNGKYDEECGRPVDEGHAGLCE